MIDAQIVAADDIYLRTGPFVTHLATDNPLVRQGIAQLYDDFCRLPAQEFSDFHVAVASPLLRRWWRRNVTFFFEGAPLFLPSPWAHAALIFEWGLNWVIATNAHQYLAIHAAVLERGGRALILPGKPGSGKSTLAAGLAYRGWNLLSDELALVVPDTGTLLGLDRPISLKNNSIDLIRQFAPDAVLGPATAGTSKGTIALAKAPSAGAAQPGGDVLPAWVVFLNLEIGAPPRLVPRPKAESFIELAANGMNYSVLGERGFEVLAGVVDRSRCFEFTYGDLAEAVRVMTEMADAS